jgi:hypothetical protein
MASFAWKIDRVTMAGPTLVEAHYRVTASEGSKTVETEGNWRFRETKSMTDTTEEMIAGWIEAESVIDGVCTIKRDLDRQLASTETVKTPPWIPKTFKLG